MYFIRIESFVFPGLSHCTNTLPVLKSPELLSVLFVLWLELQAVLKPAERQI